MDNSKKTYISQESLQLLAQILLDSPVSDAETILIALPYELLDEIDEAIANEYHKRSLANESATT